MFWEGKDVNGVRGLRGKVKGREGGKEGRSRRKKKKRSVEEGKGKGKGKGKGGEAP